MLKRVGKVTDNFTPLNTCREHIWCEVLHLHNILTSLAPKANVMGPKLGRWCKFYRVKGHHTEDYYPLKKEIERLIQDEHLNKYVKSNSYHGLDKSYLRG